MELVASPDGPRHDRHQVEEPADGLGVGGQAAGTVDREITSDTEASGRTVRASADDPQYEVRSEKSGRTAVHEPGALHQA